MHFSILLACSLRIIFANLRTINSPWKLLLSVARWHTAPTEFQQLKKNTNYPRYTPESVKFISPQSLTIKDAVSLSATISFANRRHTNVSTVVFPPAARLGHISDHFSYRKHQKSFTNTKFGGRVAVKMGTEQAPYVAGKLAERRRSLVPRLNLPLSNRMDALEVSSLC